jgi:hypothetical protein
MTGQKVKVASVQAAPVSMDLTQSIMKLGQLAKEAAAEGAQLVVFPEAFLSCYPRFAEFAVGHRTLESRTLFAKYVQSSMMIPDDCFGPKTRSRARMEYDPFYSLLSTVRSAGVVSSTVMKIRQPVS